MEELAASLESRNIVKLTELIESSKCPKTIAPESLSLLSTFLIQKAGCSSSPSTIDWLYTLVKAYPNTVREISENFSESVQKLSERCPDLKKLYEIKGKLSLAVQARNEAPEASTATPEQINEYSDDESEEINYQDFSVSSI
jgi:hypothetical protein